MYRLHTNTQYESFSLSLLACATALSGMSMLLQHDPAPLSGWLLERTPMHVSVFPSTTPSLSTKIDQIIEISPVETDKTVVVHTSMPSADAAQPTIEPVVESPLPAQTTLPAAPVSTLITSPVSRVPHWGTMRNPAEWNRSYGELSDTDFTAIPAYNLTNLTRPLSELIEERTVEDELIITAKLYYSTRFFGAYDIDAGEFTGNHPGVDLKLALGTPLGSIGAGVVHRIGNDPQSLGLYVIVEHVVDGETYYAIYGHLESAAVGEGQTIEAGAMIGTVGMTGQTTGPHVHLQIDRKPGGVDDSYLHTPYWPASMPGRSEALQHTVHPITFMHQH